jgi:hypothetical protein
LTRYFELFEKIEAAKQDKLAQSPGIVSSDDPEWDFSRVEGNPESAERHVAVPSALPTEVRPRTATSRI